MRVFRSLDEIQPSERGAAVAIGKFDGVHAGHLGILRALAAAAAERSLDTVVFTFEENPLSVLAPESCPVALTSPNQRVAELERAGVETTVMVPFDADLSELSAETFAQSVLVNRLNAKYVAVGSDFRFGKGGEGDAQLLGELGERLGFEVEIPDDVLSDEGLRVSSTTIREALNTGDIAVATQLLGRYPRVTGIVVQGDARGREIGYPTANVDGDLEGLVPADGVYAGWLFHNEHRYPSAISIGTNPTFAGERARRVEAFILDETLDLYFERVHVDFVSQLRPTLTFSSVEELIQQMDLDVLKTRQVLHNSEQI